jgi:hypothetical protein
MDAIERRSVLRGILCVAATAGLAASSLPAMVEAMPLAPQKDLGSRDLGNQGLGGKDLGSDADDLTVRVQAVASRPPRRPMARPPRRPPRRHRRRRWVCWWHRGHRICGWR